MDVLVRAALWLLLPQTIQTSRVLHLKNYPSLSDETLDLLANSCPGLEEFRYRYQRINRAITDRGIERMVGAAKNLKHLHLELGRNPEVTEDLVKRLRGEYQDLHITSTRITFRIS